MSRDVWTVVWVDTVDGFKHEVVRDRSSLHAKIITAGPGCIVVPGEPLTFYVDTSPRITFEAPKTRAKRSDAGKPRKAKGEHTTPNDKGEHVSR
jgi:hypothetical protein